jgi:CRP-like cAMP-binding protein
VTSGEATAFFEAVPLLHGLGSEDRKLLAPHCRVRAYEKGATIFTEGDPAHELCFVVLGRVKIVKTTPGRELIIGLFGPGEPIGLVAVFDGKPYPASAVALEPSTVLHVAETEFFGALCANPSAARRLIQGLMLRQMELTKRLADLTGSVEHRLARLFLTLAEKMGKGAKGGIEIPLVLSRQEIADLGATTIETAIRVMSRWIHDSRPRSPEGARRELSPRPSAVSP